MKNEPSLTTRPISTMLYRDEEGPKGIHHYVIRSGQMPAPVRYWTPDRIPHGADPEDQIRIHVGSWEQIPTVAPRGWDEDNVAWTPPTSFDPPLFVSVLIGWALSVVIFLPIVLAIAALEAAP